MPLKIIRENIVRLPVDAIVNAANPALRAGGGVCGAIFDAAGRDALQRACDAIAPCPTGHAVLTPGFDLPARHVIHAVGPVWQGGGHGEEALLRGCYRNALALAEAHGLQSVAFPLISSGIYGYPKAEALSVAVSEISAFLMHSDLLAYIVVFDRSAFQLSRKLFDSVASYIDDRYADVHADAARARRAAFCASQQPAPPGASPALENVLSRVGETFSERLLRLIDERGETDAAVYKRANIDRKHFSKIRSHRDYRPTKPTALAFAVALGLTLEETKELLACAGFALSRASRFDLAVAYFIEAGERDIFTINEALFAFDLPQLGG